MDSWWELGEGVGHSGDTLVVWNLKCPFCLEKGNFTMAFHGEKKKPTSDKRLNFDVYKCGNCAGFVHVLWSSSEHARGLGRGIHNYKVLPWPLADKPEPSENWPEGMHRFWIQAHDSLRNENWDAAAVMARSALQFIAREKKATGKNLKEEINALASAGVLNPLMQEWSHEVRELGNDSAHPELSSLPTTEEDAKDIVNFLDFLLFYLYDLPKQIGEYRKRNTPTTP